jgi:hypothetical protein
MRTNPSLASIESPTVARLRFPVISRRRLVSTVLGQSITSIPNPRHPLKQEYDTGDARVEERMVFDPNERLSRTDHTIGNSVRESRVRERGAIGNKRLAQSSRDGGLDRNRKRVRRSVVLDLTESDSEGNNELESHTSLASTHGQVQQPIAEAEQQVQQLRNKLHNKTVTEIKTTLAANYGKIPAWIEEVIKQELGTKMLRDLGTIEDLF